MSSKPKEEETKEIPVVPDELVNKIILQYSQIKATPDELTTAYETFGVTEDKLAIGLNPVTLVQYLGSREFLVTKAMEDIPALDRVQAEEEVDKMLMDVEVISAYAEFNKWREENPDVELPDEDDEGLFSLRNIVGGYATFIAGTKGYNYYVLNYESQGKTFSDMISDLAAQAQNGGADAADSIGGGL